MNQVIAAVLSAFLRIVWVLFGLVLLVSFLFAAVVAVVVLGVRYVWARLTGKPVAPFIFSSFSRRQGAQWGQFKSTADAWTAKAKAKAKGPFSPAAKAHIRVADVTDVESRPSRSAGPSR